MISKTKTKSNNRGIALKKYMLIILPAVVLNSALMLDHVIAKNTEHAFSARMTEIINAQDDEPLRKTIRSHWVKPNDDGSIDGRISAIDLDETVPIENLKVSLVKSGNKEYEGVTDAEGRFRMENVDAGVYTLIAAGKNGFMAYGVQILPKVDPGNSIFDGLDTRLERKEAVRAYYVSHYGLPKNAMIQDGFQIDAAAVPPEFSTLEEITKSYVPDSGTMIGVDIKGIGKATEVSGGYKHTLTADGSFKGRIQPIATDGGRQSTLTGMNIFLIQDDVRKGRVPVEDNGDFEIKDVKPGIYAIVAAGKDGFAALSMELVAGEPDSDVQGALGKNGFQYVSTRKQDPIPPIGIAIVTDPADLQVVQAEVQNVVQLQQQFQQPFDPNAGDMAFNDSPMFDASAPISSSGFPAGPGLPVSGPGFPSAGFPTSPGFPVSSGFPVNTGFPAGVAPPVGNAPFVPAARTPLVGGFPGLLGPALIGGISIVGLVDDDPAPASNVNP